MIFTSLAELYPRISLEIWSDHPDWLLRWIVPMQEADIKICDSASRAAMFEDRHRLSCFADMRGSILPIAKAFTSLGTLVV